LEIKKEVITKLKLEQRELKKNQGWHQVLRRGKHSFSTGGIHHVVHLLTFIWEIISNYELLSNINVIIQWYKILALVPSHCFDHIFWFKVILYVIRISTCAREG
jgi:hypothetical protein